MNYSFHDKETGMPAKTLNEIDEEMCKEQGIEVNTNKYCLLFQYIIYGAPYFMGNSCNMNEENFAYWIGEKIKDGTEFAEGEIALIRLFVLERYTFYAHRSM